MTSLEIEVKFFVAHESDMRKRLSRIGAVSRGRVFETNIRFDDADRTLTRNRSLLRLRRDQRVRLTLKRPPPVEDPDFKILRELEVDVGNFDRMTEILSELGFHREQIYEKWRETFHLRRVALCLDTMPYGSFLEVEGDGGAIREAADRLGLAWSSRILKNYLEIFELIRAREGLPFTDLTFDNFEAHPVDLSRYVDDLREA